MRPALFLLLLLALPAFTADTPLSDILIDGEGWKPAGDTMFDFPPVVYKSKKDDKGNWGVYKGDKLVATAAKGEVFGETALSPRGGQLVVGVPSHHYLYTFQVQADGSLKYGEKCYTLRKEKPGKGGSNAGNMVFDTKGRLFVAMPEGVQYFDEEMRFSGQLSRPVRERVRIVFLAKDTLYVACGGAVWKRKLKALGVMPSKP